jgi:cytohesin
MAGRKYEEITAKVTGVMIQKRPIEEIRRELGKLLSQAAGNGDADKVTYLLQISVDANYADGWPEPLFEAASNGHTTIVKMLLDAGASPNLSRGSQPLQQACVNGHARIVEMLLQAGAWINERTEVKFIKDSLHTTRIYGGRTALDFACMNGHADVVEVMLKAGANPNTFDVNKCTPLIHSTSQM